MADYIRMDTQQLETLSAQMSSLSSSLQRMRRTLSRVHVDSSCGADVKVDLSSLRLKTAQWRMSAGTVADSISCLCRALDAMGESTGALSGRIAGAADTFSDAEMEFVRRFGGTSVGAASAFAQACGQLGLDPDRSKWTPEMNRRFEEAIKRGDFVQTGDMVIVRDGDEVRFYFPDGIVMSHEEKHGLVKNSYSDRLTFPGGASIAGEGSFGLQHLGLSYDGIDLIEQEKHSKVFGNGGKSVLPKGNPLKIASVGWKGGGSISALYGENSYEGEHASGSVEASLLKAEYSYSAQGGMGVFLPDENGNPQLYFGGEGKIGASVCAAEVSAQGEYELIDNVSLVGEVNASAMEAQLQAAAGAGVVGGKFVAYAKAGAEADLVKVEGKVGVDVAGIKGQVGGSVKVGIGASANVGYNDGKFSLELSAALGVGADVNLELDVSGFVDNAKATFGKAAQGASKAYNWAKDGISNLFGGW